MRLNLRLNSNNWWNSIKPWGGAKHEMRAKPLGSESTGYEEHCEWQGRDRAGQGSPSTSTGTTTAPALLPAESWTRTSMEQNPHAFEHLVTTTPESVCRSRSASGIKMTLLTTPIIPNEFSVYLHTLPSCIDIVVFLETKMSVSKYFSKDT